MNAISVQSNTDSSLLENLLSQCEPGHLTPEVFEAIARVAVYPAVEFIPLRKRGDGKIEVLLLERPANDVMWPGMLHTPGTVLRPTDNTMEDAFTRLYTDELCNVPTTTPRLIGVQLSHNRRGTCLLLEHVVTLKSEPLTGKYYDVENLPPKFIPEQADSLDRAVLAFTTE